MSFGSHFSLHPFPTPLCIHIPQQVSIVTKYFLIAKIDWIDGFDIPILMHLL